MPGFTDPVALKESFAARSTSRNTVDVRARTRGNSHAPGRIQAYSTRAPGENSARGVLDPFAHFGLLHHIWNVRTPQKKALLHPGKDVRDNGRECSVRDGPPLTTTDTAARPVLCGLQVDSPLGPFACSTARASACALLEQGQAAERIRRQTAYGPPRTGNHEYRIPVRMRAELSRKAITARQPPPRAIQVRPSPPVVQTIAHRRE
jgi:hypothetical protein